MFEPRQQQLDEESTRTALAKEVVDDAGKTTTTEKRRRWTRRGARARRDECADAREWNEVPLRARSRLKIAVDSWVNAGACAGREKVFEKGTPRNNRPNAFDVQPTQPSASQQFEVFGEKS